MNVFYGKGHFSGSCSSKTIRPIFKKFGAINYVSEMTQHADFEVGAKGAWLWMHEVVAVTVRSPLLTAQMTHPGGI